MQKDLKIGLVLGLALVIAAVLWLATRPSLSPKARMPRLDSDAPPQENAGSPNNLSTDESSPDVNQPSTSQSRPSLDGIHNQTQLTDSTRYEQAEKIKTQRFHIVRKGQTLSEISYKYYGSAGKWQKILEANRNTIKDPNKITPGTKLIIPD